MNSRSSGTESATEARDARVQPTGTLLDGKFRVVGVLGAGTAGVVYEIVHEETRLRRALRVLDRTETLSSDDVDDALRQADAAGKLRHPHLVEVFAVGKLDDGSPYILMELLQGVTLTQRIKETGGLSLEELGEVLGQACDGLQAAHDAGLVLRQLRPEKVFITSGAGRPLVKLLDVGLARLCADATDANRYQALEQKADATRATARSDVFALGVMLYEAASGQYPVSSRGEPERLNPRLPPALAELASSAMAADPARRPPTARAFGDALRVITRDASVDPLGKTLPVTDGKLLQLEIPPPPPARVTPSVPSPSASDPGLAHRPGSGRASAPPPPRRGSAHLKIAAVVLVATLAAVAVAFLQRELRHDEPRPAPSGRRP